MTAVFPEFRPGALVFARGRDWLVLPGSPTGTVLARPLAGMDDEISALLPALEEVRPATFQPPTVDDRGDASRARLLRDALRLSFRATAGPFRSFGSLAVAPRNYQLVPLMMSVAQETTRLLIADGVGVGKTIEAGLIVAELLATGEAERLAVLCSPQLAPQWQAELRSKFGIHAELLLPSTAARLSRGLPFGSTSTSTTRTSWSAPTTSSSAVAGTSSRCTARTWWSSMRRTRRSPRPRSRVAART